MQQNALRPFWLVIASNLYIKLISACREWLQAMHAENQSDIGAGLCSCWIRTWKITIRAHCSRSIHGSVFCVYGENDWIVFVRGQRFVIYLCVWCSSGILQKSEAEWWKDGKWTCVCMCAGVRAGLQYILNLCTVVACVHVFVQIARSYKSPYVLMCADRRPVYLHRQKKEARPHR